MNEATYVYIVHSDINENNIYAEFATEEEALDYARRHKDELTYVDKVEAALDEDGEIIEIFDGQTIWVYDDEFDGYAGDMEENVFDTDFDGGYPLDEGINLKNDAERKEFFQLCDEIGIITAKDIINFKKEVGCTDENILQALRDYRAELGPDFKIADPELEKEMAKKYEEIDFDALVEELEENEDMVECKECFDLVAKESCTKGEHGYVCEKCAGRLTEENITEGVDDASGREPAVIDKKTLDYVRNELAKDGYSFFEVGIATGGSGPYYDGNLILELRYEDGVYFADQYIDCGDGPKEDPDYLDEVGEHDTLEELLNALVETGWVILSDDISEAIKMTRAELMDKEGTDDVELINAGRPEEERVELDEYWWNDNDPMNWSDFDPIVYNVTYKGELVGYVQFGYMGHETNPSKEEIEKLITLLLDDVNTIPEDYSMDDVVYTLGDYYDVDENLPIVEE